MRYVRSAPVAIMLTTWLTVFGLPCHGAPQATDSRTEAAGEPASDDEFQETLAKTDAAQLELQNGNPAAFKALWSHADDVTLAGGFGGTIEKGWEQISRRLDWVAAQYSNGTHTHERVVAKADRGLAYVVQMEHIRFHVPGQANPSARDYRVTMVFRRESGGWRIVHRQADSQLTKQAPQ